MTDVFSTRSSPPRALAHVGLTVPDLDAATAWYGEVLGFRPIAPPAEFEAGVGHLGHVCADLFGPAFGRTRMALLSAANGAAIELFEFVRPPYEPPSEGFAPWRGGWNHLCVIEPDIEGLSEAIAAAGGQRRSEIWTLFDGEPYRLCYCADPFGNVVEIITHGMEQVFANRGPTPAQE